jgi:DNA-binding NarL/FixJ family response regulator
LAINLYEGRNLPLHELLSDREFQVLKFLADGKSVKEIAEELFLSVKTISTYRSRILEKLNFKNNSELIRYVLEHKIFE